MDDISKLGPINRRSLFKGSAMLGGSAILAPGVIKADLQKPTVDPGGERPTIPYGVQWGDLTPDQVTLWTATDRPARLQLEIATDPGFKSNKRIINGPAALEDDEFTVKLIVDKLPREDKLYYRILFKDLSTQALSAPLEGKIPLTKSAGEDIRFVWSGDTAGQGWGINLEWGGMRIYDVMRKEKPDFFIHSGDCIYADGPLKERVELDDGTIWKNVMIPEKAKVAESLKSFVASTAITFLDANVRSFNREVPQYFQWDDHETVNNWYPGEILTDDRYVIKSVDLLAARAKKAFFEYTNFSDKSAQRSGLSQDSIQRRS